ncbi:MAG: hypothetical protein V9E89_06520 [Ilumatobacteraceae bacterium]
MGRIELLGHHHDQRRLRTPDAHRGGGHADQFGLVEQPIGHERGAHPGDHRGDRTGAAPPPGQLGKGVLGLVAVQGEDAVERGERAHQGVVRGRVLPAAVERRRPLGGIVQHLLHRGEDGHRRRHPALTQQRCGNLPGDAHGAADLGAAHPTGEGQRPAQRVVGDTVGGEDAHQGERVPGLQLTHRR